MNINRSYIVYHTFSLNNKTFLIWTFKDIGVMKINKKKNETGEFSSLKSVNLKLQDLIKAISYK